MYESFPAAATQAAPLLALPSVGIIGAGAMGEALLSGITKFAGSLDGAVRATSYSAARAEHVGERLGVKVEALAEQPDANIRIAEASDVVVLATSPDRVPSVLADISGSLRPGAIVISLAAGVTLHRLTSLLPESVTAVRVMPNLGGQVGFGVTGIGYHGGVSEEQLPVIRDVWSTVGKVVIVRDDQLDAVSSISGTGPAYFYYFAEQLTTAAADLGFTPEQARLLAEHTFVGAAAVMQSSGESPRDLLRYFTDPAGTSMRAVREMANHDLRGMLVTAASATMARAREIADEAESSGLGR